MNLTVTEKVNKTLLKSGIKKFPITGEKINE